jgi:hypothetical protein
MAKKKQRRGTPTQSSRPQTASVGRIQTFEKHAAARTHKRRRVTRRNPVWLIGGLLLGVVIVIGAFIALANSQRSTGTIGPTDPTVLKNVTHVKSEVFAAVNTGGVSNIAQATTTGSTILKGPDGKPEIFYYGAEWCPICAGTRWPLAVALSRFGTFTELPLNVSPQETGFSELATLTFHGAKYTSEYLDFVPLEAEDRDKKTLDTPTTNESSLLQKYQVTGFPFIDVAERFTISGGFYDPTVLSGLSQQDIANKLTNANDGVTKQIIGTANYLTAAICAVTDKKPATVCAADPISTLTNQMEQGTMGTPASQGQMIALGRREELI